MAGPALTAALDKLTVWDVWRAAGLPHAGHKSAKAWGDDGMHLSPFRVESGPSFSVSADGKLYKDFGERGKGGDVWEFAQKAWPSDNDGGVAKRLIGLAGTEHMDTGEAPSEREKKRLERQRKEEKQRRASERAAAAWGWPEAPDGMDLSEWPAVVRERWMSGVRATREVEKPFDYLSRWRGWPVELCVELVACGAMSFPMQKFWSDGAANGKRSVAFRVEAPVDGGLRMLALGYHQVWRSMDGKRKGFLFFPCVPKDPKCEYDRSLVALGRRVPSVPFALGEKRSPKKVTILEGQWDAATYHWRSGGFDDGAGQLTLGLRGASSWRLALAMWAHVFDGAEVVVIPDNDTAGRAWCERSKAGDPCLVDILEMRARSVVVKQIPSGLTLKSGKGVKDFNDFFVYKRERQEW